MFAREKDPWENIVNRFWIFFLAVVVPVYDQRPKSWQDSSDFKGTSVISPF